ncbi:MAG: gluconokinase [Chloroflexota bacterium]
MFVIIMGISGSGKSTVGRLLADRLHWPFFDGDDFHPPENIAKMASGIPLADDDRREWLERLSVLVKNANESGENGILACSALKLAYRQKLNQGHVCFVYLKGNYEVIFERLTARTGHFMRSAMLQSQIDTLEEPSDAFTIDIGHSPDEIVELIIDYLARHD